MSGEVDLGSAPPYPLDCGSQVHGPRPPLPGARYLLQWDIWHRVLIALFYGLPAKHDIDGAGVDEPWNPPADANCSDRSQGNTHTHTHGADVSRRLAEEVPRGTSLGESSSQPPATHPGSAGKGILPLTWAGVRSLLRGPLGAQLAPSSFSVWLWPLDYFARARSEEVSLSGDREKTHSRIGETDGMQDKAGHAQRAQMGGLLWWRFGSFSCSQPLSPLCKLRHTGRPH